MSMTAVRAVRKPTALLLVEPPPSAVILRDAESEIRSRAPTFSVLTDDINTRVLRSAEKIGVAVPPSTWLKIATLLRMLADFVGLCDVPAEPRALHEWLTHRPFARFRAFRFRRAIRKNWTGDPELMPLVEDAILDRAERASLIETSNALHERKLLWS